MGKTGASLNRAGSKQSYRTPREFLTACERRFGTITFDLAAHSRNCVVPDFFGKKQDSLRQDWGKLHGLNWLNPPFDDVRPWTRKCAISATPDVRILLLVRASVDSEWFYKHLYGNALVLPLRQRITFVGSPDPYPSSLMLAYFDGGKTVGFEPWRWRDQCEPQEQRRPQDFFDSQLCQCGHPRRVHFASVASCHQASCMCGDFVSAPAAEAAE